VLASCHSGTQKQRIAEKEKSVNEFRLKFIHQIHLDDSLTYSGMFGDSQLISTGLYYLHSQIMK